MVFSLKPLAKLSLLETISIFFVDPFWVRRDLELLNPSLVPSADLGQAFHGLKHG